MPAPVAPIPLTVVRGVDAEMLRRWSSATVVRSTPVIASRTPGCACCRTRLDLVDELRRAVERRHRPEHVVLHLADDDIPPVTQTLLADPDLARLVELDRVVVAVDAVRWATRLAAGLPVDVDDARAVGSADRVVLTGANRLVPGVRARLAAIIRGANRLTHVAPTIGDLVVTHSWHGAPAGSDGAVATGMAGLPVSVVCAADTPLDPDAIDDWLDDLVRRHATRLLRVQGAVRVRGQEHRVCCRGVLSFGTSHSETAPGHVRSTSSRMVLVGFDLDPDELRRTFSSAASA